MPSPGRGLANVRVQDDTRALEQQMLAKCHTLRVVHHIRLRGDALEAFNEAPSIVELPERDRSESHLKLPLSHTVPEEMLRSKLKREKMPGTDFGPGDMTSSTSPGIWSLIKDLLLIYAVFAVTFFLAKFLFSGFCCETSYSFKP